MQLTAFYLKTTYEMCSWIMFKSDTGSACLGEPAGCHAVPILLLLPAHSPQLPRNRPALGMPTFCSSSPPTHRQLRLAPTPSKAAHGGSALSPRSMSVGQLLHRAGKRAAQSIPKDGKATHGGSALSPHSVLLLWGRDTVGVLQDLKIPACSTAGWFLHRAGKPSTAKPPELVAGPVAVHNQPKAMGA